MTLATVLRFKIVATALLWCLPLLLAPAGLLGFAGIPTGDAVVFVRLLGAAYLALLVGYVLGLRRLRSGGDARDAVFVGIASNGLASILLLLHGLAGAYADWGPLARTYVYVSVALTAAITIGLVLTGLRRAGGHSRGGT